MKKSIIERTNEVLYHFACWLRVTLFIIFIPAGIIMFPLDIIESANKLAQVWGSGDFLRIFSLVAGIIFLSILTSGCAIFLGYVIYFIENKFYAYFVKKDKNALRDILNKFVY